MYSIIEIMENRCPDCKREFVFDQIEILEKRWSFLKNTNNFSIKQNIVKTPLKCHYCEFIFDESFLWKYGMFHHNKAYNPGFGTNFHEMYKNKAKIYHRFSCSEDKEGVIFQKIVDTKKDGILLDVACGTGKYIKLLSPYFEKVYGLDSSKTLLEFARRETSDIKNIEYILAKAEKIPLLDNSIDVVVTTWGSFSPNEVIPEMKRVLKKDGIIIRVGVTSKDDLTSLFPNFNEEYIKSNNKYWVQHGFSEEKTIINIVFDSVKESKEILSEITGSDPDKIRKSILQHKIIIQIFKNNL